MNEAYLFISSFSLVCALVLQHRFVERRGYLAAAINSGFIAALNILAVKLGAQASPSEITAFILGQPFATLMTMAACDRWLVSSPLANKPAAR